DFTVRGGAADASIAMKQVHSEVMAREFRVPVVRLIDGTGGGGSVKTYDQVGRTYVPANPGWDHVVPALSEIPVVAAALGPVAGLGAARMATSHFAVMVKGVAQVFVARPPDGGGGRRPGVVLRDRAAVGPLAHHRVRAARRLARRRAGR